jgi:hypothetical protein
VDAQREECLVQVELDGLLAQEKSGGNVAIAQSGGDRLGHPALRR